MKKIAFIALLFIANFTQAQTASEFSKLAKSDLESRMYSNAKRNATKAIELEPNNQETRWIRIKASMTSASKADDYKTAIADLEFLLSAGDQSEKVYKSLGLANQNYAVILQQDFSDNKSAINHYLKAKEAYEKAKNISGNSDYAYDIKDVSELLNEANKKEKNR